MIRKFCLRNTDHVVAVSNNLKSFLLNNHIINRRNKITVLPNAADTQAFDKDFDIPAIKKSLGLVGEFVIVYAVTLQMCYAIEDVISALPLVLREIPNALLLIVGQGQAKEKLENLSKELKITDKVRFTGYIDHMKIPEILSIADVVVAPFKELGMSFFGSAIKIFEYLSSGKPIVATKIGQIAEILQDQYTALLVKPGAVDELANAIIRLARDERLRSYLAKNAKMEAQKYSWDKHVERLVDIYRAQVKYSPLGRGKGWVSWS